MGLGSVICNLLLGTSEYEKRMEARRTFDKRIWTYMFTQGVVGAVLFIMKAVNPAYGWIWYSKTVLFWKFFAYCATNLVYIIVGEEGLDDYDSLHIAAYCLTVSSVLDIFYVLYKVAQVVAPGFLEA